MSEGVRVQPTSRNIRSQWFYDDTYLEGPGADDGPLLFVHHFVEYVTKAGNRHLRRADDVIGFGDEDEMAAWIEAHDAQPSGDPNGEDREWVPTEWAGARRA